MSFPSPPWPGPVGLSLVLFLPLCLTAVFLLHLVLQGPGARVPRFFRPHAQGRFALRPPSFIGMVTLAALVFTAGTLAYHAAAHPGASRMGERDRGALYRYVTRHAGPNDVIVFHRPRAMKLHTGRKSVRLDTLEDIMCSRARFIACKRGDLVDMALRERVWIARRVYANDSFILYARTRASPVAFSP